MDELAYRFCAQLVKGLTKIMGYRLIIEESHHVPAHGPVILAINHAGYTDFAYSSWSPVFDLGRWPRFLAKKEVFGHKVAGPLLRSMKHIPVDRSGNPAAAVRLAIKALKAGELVATHPEGTVNRSFVPMSGKTGTVRIAQAAGAPIIPCAVWGAHRIATKAHALNFRRRIPIMVRYGPPLELEPREDARAATQRLMKAIRDLLSDLQERYPESPKDEEDKWWLPAHLGGTAPTFEQIVTAQGHAGID
ncbi:MAG: lysophospholipid acyltransferase family protein [Actinomycetota bacterium]